MKAVCSSETSVNIYQTTPLSVLQIKQEVRVGKYSSDNFPIQNGPKQGDALLPLLFSFALVYAIRKVRENQVELKLNVTSQLLVYADDMYLLGDDIDTIMKNTKT
jgi:hypothetical protein